MTCGTNAAMLWINAKKFAADKNAEIADLKKLIKEALDAEIGRAHV